MKRKMLLLIAAILTLTVLFTLAGCGSDGKDSEKTDNKPAETAAATEAPAGAIAQEDLVFTHNGASVELNTSADEAVAALGEYQDAKSQLSCHGEGDDKTYTYDGFVLNTYPLDGKDMVLEIVIKSAGIPTSKGVQVGDTVDQVTAAYGDGYREVGMYYAYEDGSGKSLQFFIENGTVQEISYYYDV